MEAPSRTANVWLSSAIKRCMCSVCIKSALSLFTCGVTQYTRARSVKRRNILIPLRPGSFKQFETLRQVLEASNYTEKAICERLGIETIFDFRSTLEAEPKSRV